ncbi:MAG: GatB/YqeY domain-containing protein [Candidatus Brennerbacteria bacterium]|nr:GatB/YqeY domain-containing protein [Candidatus Brennerbacteria bacterium]
MSLQSQLSLDLVNALKAGKSFETGVIRLLTAAMHNREIEKRSRGGKDKQLTDEEAVEILTKEAKKRKEAFEIYSKAGRGDLAEKEAAELAFIKNYLPEPISLKAVEKAVIEAIKKTGAKEAKDFGKAMGEAMKALKGKADAGAVSETVKKILGV